jgi:adenosylcobinamide kinase/adenosylcobinamide-phosphate guanylyltransferase
MSITGCKRDVIGFCFIFERELMIELILGGARSGKSNLAEQRASASGLSVVYIATGQAGDVEMAQRIAFHRERRPKDWLIVEEPIQLAVILARHTSVKHCIIVDCLTLWLTNLLLADKASQQANEIAALLSCIKNLPGHIIFVSNEVGSGVVPLGAINRLFVDEQGRLNQKIAQLADRVTLVAAGLPLQLK